jgi:hypothetical protein
LAARRFPSRDCSAQYAAKTAGQAPRNRAIIAAREKSFSGRQCRQEGEMQVLLVAACAIIAIWLIVLWGSRYLGPQ